MSSSPKSQEPQAHLISLYPFPAVVMFKQTLYIVSSINILVCISKQTKGTEGFSWLLNYHDLFFFNSVEVSKRWEVGFEPCFPTCSV